MINTIKCIGHMYTRTTVVCFSLFSAIEDQLKQQSIEVNIVKIL